MCSISTNGVSISMNGASIAPPVTAFVLLLTEYTLVPETTVAENLGRGGGGGQGVLEPLVTQIP